MMMMLHREVEVLPRFEKELTDLLSCDGDAVEFECRISGHPAPDIRWFHYHEVRPLVHRFGIKQKML